MKVKRLMTNEELDQFLKLREEDKTNRKAAKYMASLDLFETDEQSDIEKKISRKKK